MPAKISLPVQGMRDAGCAGAIERALTARPGVIAANVSLPGSTVTIEYDPATASVAEIVAELATAGYRVRQVDLDFEVRGMHCQNCARAVERAICSVPGVLRVSINGTTGVALLTTLAGVVLPEHVVSAVGNAGYEAIQRRAGGMQPSDTALAGAAARERRLVTLGLAFTLPLVVLSMAKDAGFVGAQPWIGWILLVLAIPVQTIVAGDYYAGALRSARNHIGTMDVLIVLGSSAAFILSLGRLVTGSTDHLYFETSSVIITLVRVGKLLEARATRATGDAMRALGELKPLTASVVRNDEVVEVPVEAVRRGETVMVKPGQRIPVDGRVEAGSGAVDESMLTGESLPADKVVGSEVAAGTLNLNGLLRLSVERVGSETMLARIIRMVRDAQVTKAPIQHLADKVAAVFVPVVLGIASLTFFGWWSIGHISASDALIRAVTVVVIACPCALGLATPTAMVVGTGRAARMGVLFRSGEALERTASVDTVILDKTGTLTQGRPVVTDVVGAPDRPELPSRILTLAASVEQGSDHPIAKAITEAAAARGLRVSEPDRFVARSGHGVEAEVEGFHVAVGRPRGGAGMLADDRVVRLQHQGKTVVEVSADCVSLGFIAVADIPRDEARASVAAIRSLGISVSMLTGDHHATAATIADRVGIDTLESGLLPGDKAYRIQALRETGSVVAMVGDGINDAPALACADVGIAIGAGADVALEAADVALLRNSLRGVPAAISVARATLGTIRQNLFWAFLYNVLLIPAATAGLLHPIMAAGAMAMSSLFVVTNSLRLRGAPIDAEP